MTFCDELRALAQEATTAGAAAEILVKRHPELSPKWIRLKTANYLNNWCNEGLCERQRTDGQPTVFQMKPNEQ